MSYPNGGVGSPLPADALSLDDLDLEQFDFDDLIWTGDFDRNAQVEVDSIFNHYVHLEHLSDHRTTNFQDGDLPKEPVKSTIKRAPINGSRGPLEILVCESSSRTQRKLDRLLSAMRCRTVLTETRERAIQYLSNGVQFDLIIAEYDDGPPNFAQSLRKMSTEMPMIGIKSTFSEGHDFEDFDAVLELPLTRAKLEDVFKKFYPQLQILGLTERDEPDSDCSWAATDDREDWQFEFKKHLRRFRDQNDRISLITPPLLSKQRRKIHAMAHLYRLSHTSLGCGKYKRVLIVKCQLLRTSSSLHRWNPGRSRWTEGIVDPRIMTFKNVSGPATTDDISSWFSQTGLPGPALVHREDSQAEDARHRVHMIFEQALDAAIALEAVHGTTPSWSTTTVSCDYTLFKDCPWSPWQIPTDFNIILAQMTHLHHRNNAEAQDPGRIKLERRSLSVISSSEDDTISESEFSDVQSYRRSSTSTRYSAATTNPSTASFSTIATSSRTADTTSLYTPSTTTSHQPTYAPSTSSSTKRKRLPPVPSGYTCTFHSCGKTFDHAGDCRKHEKIHTDRSHVCEICGKAFLYAKDVRRHCQSVHVWKETLMAQRAVRRVRPVE